MSVLAAVVSTVAGVITVALVAVARRQAERMRIASEELSMRRIEQELRLSEFSRALTPGESARASEYALAHNMRVHMQVEAKVTRPARSRSAIGLTEFAASVLPASDRERYAEEFRAELQDLAQSGAGHLRQLLYGLRQIRGIVHTRYALRSPRHKSATP